MPTNSPADAWSLLIAVGVLACFLLYGVFGSGEPASLGLIIVTAIVLAGFVVLGAALASRRHFSTWPRFGQFAQGLASLITIAALFIAAGIYFAERRDKPKLAFNLVSNAMVLPREKGRPQELLLAVRVPVENTGAGRIEVKCMSLGLSGLPGTARPIRAKDTPEEMEFEPFKEKVNFVRGQECNTREEDRKGLPRDSVRPQFRWSPFALEPGEVDDRYFETVVPCRYSIIRLLVKLRVNPGDRYGYESKALVPLTGVCRGDKELVSGLSSSAEGAPNQNASSGSPESNVQSPAAP